MPHARCPDFNLAPLESFAPEALSKTAADSFLLSLAVAFNDLKGLLWFWDQLTNGDDPAEKGATAYRGQLNGMKFQIHRLLTGLLFELLNLLKRGLDEKLFADPFLVRAMTRLPAGAKAAWADLTLAASKGGSKDPFWLYLCRVRNDAAFHYASHPKILAKGYHHHFFELPRSEINEHAFWSLGDSLEASRFYFADAAVQGFGQDLDAGGMMEQTIAHVKKANTALRHLVEKYVRLKVKAVKRSSGRS